MPERRGRVLNRAELSEFTGKSLPTIDAWRRVGCPFVTEGGRGHEWSFNSADVLDWLEARAVERAVDTAPKGDLDPAQERARKDRALAEQAEMKNAVTRGEWIREEDILVQLGRELAVVKERFLGMKGKMSDALTGPQLKRLEDEVWEALDELSRPEEYDACQEAKKRQERARELSVRRADRKGQPSREL